MDTAKDKSADDKPALPHRVLKNRDEVRDYLAELAESAMHEIVIFAPRLDADLFNSARFARALASFAARHRHNLARIVVEDTEQALRDNDRLVELCRRLSDFIHLQQVGEEHLGRREMFVVVDHQGYLRQQDLAKPDCIAHPRDTREAVVLVRRFNELWDRSEAIASLRTSGL